MQALAERARYSEDPANLESNPKSLEDAVRIIDQQKQLIDNLEERLRLDDLSGLMNKAAWHDDVVRRVADAKPFGIVLLDLDKFKRINDELSHREGDLLIESFGKTLNEKFRRDSDQLSFINHDEDSILRSRIGGDEFALTIDLSENARRGDDVHRRMDQVYSYIERIWTDFLAEQDPILEQKGLGLAIGPAVWDPNNPVSAVTLYKQADEAMYEYKHHTAENDATSRKPRALGSVALH